VPIRRTIVSGEEFFKNAEKEGWSVKETAQRLNFLDRFVIPPHLTALAPKIQEVGLERVYRLLSAE